MKLYYSLCEYVKGNNGLNRYCKKTEDQNIGANERNTSEHLSNEHGTPINY